MDIDPDISYWILDFLLRQPLQDRILNALLRSLPLPDNKPNLKILLLLKKLQSGSISLSALEILEQLEEVLFHGGNGEVLESMKRAYCAVAVKCTEECLTDGQGGENDCKFKFFEVVKRVWREKVGRMQKLVEGGLGSKELWDWKDEIEAAVWEDIAYDNVVTKCKLVNAVEAVSVYIREERERLGPPFIQLVANSLRDDEVLKEVLLETEKVAEVGGKLETSHPAGQETNAGKNNQEVQKENFRSRSKRSRLDYFRGVKIINSEEGTNQSSYKDYKLPCSAEVQRAQEALASSSLELQASVKDPLPDALQLAETISQRKGKNDDCLGVNGVEANVFNVDGAGVVQGIVCNKRRERKPNLMERNSTACTHEWNESIDNSSEESAGRNGGLQLPTPRNTQTSPLKKYEIRDFKKRKIRKKWSPLEEDTLRTGVERFGKGNWKLILTFYHDTFVDRTEVDLKDKWRNMTRY